MLIFCLKAMTRLGLSDAEIVLAALGVGEDEDEAKCKSFFLYLKSCFTNLGIRIHRCCLASRKCLKVVEANHSCQQNGTKNQRRRPHHILLQSFLGTTHSRLDHRRPPRAGPGTTPQASKANQRRHPPTDYRQIPNTITTLLHSMAQPLAKPPPNAHAHHRALLACADTVAYRDALYEIRIRRPRDRVSTGHGPSVERECEELDEYA